MTLSAVPVEHVLTFTAHLLTPAMVPGAPQGMRGIVAVTGGSFEGPRLRGTIEAPGGDWFTIRPSGSVRLDVRLLLMTDDDAAILLTYTGIAAPGIDGTMVNRVAAQFEAPDGPHAWLNDVQAIGFGRRVPDGAAYDLYSFG
jgi:hypothetical protein